MKKITLKKYGENGWIFYINGKGKRTNKNGEGLWLLGTKKSDFVDKQIEGLCQFSLPNDRKAAYNKLYHLYFYDDIYEPIPC